MLAFWCQQAREKNENWHKKSFVSKIISIILHVLKKHNKPSITLVRFRVQREERIAREAEERQRREEEARAMAEEQRRRDEEQRLQEEKEAQERAKAEQEESLRLQKQVKK